MPISPLGDYLTPQKAKDTRSEAGRKLFNMVNNFGDEISEEAVLPFILSELTTIYGPDLVEHAARRVLFSHRYGSTETQHHVFPKYWITKDTRR